MSPEPVCTVPLPCVPSTLLTSTSPDPVRTRSWPETVPNRTSPEFNNSVEAPIDYVGDGDVLRFIHSQTGRNLHSHSVAAPVSKADYEVSSYGNTTIGDDKDHWTLEVVSDAAQAAVEAAVEAGAKAKDVVGKAAPKRKARSPPAPPLDGLPPIRARWASPALR